MNVYYGRTLIGSFDNSKWTEENGNTPCVQDIGREHINDYEQEMEFSKTREYNYGTAKVYSNRSDEGTLG